jgi:large subunit ribosomal protein L10
MVSERKKLAVKQLSEELKRYPVIGILDMFKLPARQLQEIKDSLRGKAVIKMTKKNIIKLAIESAGVEGLGKLENEIKNQPALLLSDVNPFELASIIESSKSSAPAKAGDIAAKDIIINEGPTSLKPGPVIGELQRVKLPAGVEGDKIVIKKDTRIVKEGEQITKPVADVLMKLGIQPAEISLNLLAVYERGAIYEKSLLFIPTEKYKNDLINAYKNAFSLALSMGYPTHETLPVLLVKAYKEAVSLALEAEVPTNDTIGTLLAEARARMESVKIKTGSEENTKAETDNFVNEKEVG